MKKTVQVIMLSTLIAHNTMIFQSNLSDSIGIALRRNMVDNAITDVDCSPSFNLPISDVTAKHLYFTSNEEIKEGDYVLDSITNKISRVVPNECIPKCCKVIATTDKSLNLPLIPQSFIEEYVKSNGEIKEVDIEWDEINQYPRFKLDNNDELFVDITKKQTIKEYAKAVASRYDYASTKYWIAYDSVIAGAEWQQSNS